MLISVVIPVYNSEKTIVPLVEQLLTAYGESYKLEVILVNDASADATAEKCKELYDLFPNSLSYLELAKNVGSHNAVLAGLANTSGDFVLIMDDDFQNPISEVKVLIDAIQSKGADVVYGDFGVKRHSFIKNFGSWVNDKMANKMLHKPNGLYLSSFKIMNRFLVDEIVRYTLPFTYIDGLIFQITSNIASVKVEHHARTEGRSGYTMPKLVALWSNMFLNFSLLPLRFFIIIGVFSAFFAFCFAIYAIIEKLSNPLLPLGYSSIAVMISFFSGLILIGLGVLGEYIGRTFQAVGKKPQYTIRKKYIKSEKETDSL